MPVDKSLSNPTAVGIRQGVPKQAASLDGWTAFNFNLPVSTWTDSPPRPERARRNYLLGTVPARKLYLCWGLLYLNHVASFGATVSSTNAEMLTSHGPAAEDQGLLPEWLVATLCSHRRTSMLLALCLWYPPYPQIVLGVRRAIDRWVHLSIPGQRMVESM
jgi:hypothetical protein